MNRLVRPTISWLLLAIVAAGHVPALVHRSSCNHASQSTSDQACAEACKHHHGSRCSHRPSHTDQGVAIGAVQSRSKHRSGTCELAVPRSHHDCETCAICQSLHSINGVGMQSNVPIACGQIQARLVASAPSIPVFNRYGISQSRAPPQVVA